MNSAQRSNAPGAVFEFGRNWTEFSRGINLENFKAARQSILDMVGEIKGRSFLDAGCGSGLFSIAALSLGAKNVVGFDCDEECLKISRINLDKLSAADPIIDRNNIRFTKASALKCEDLGEFDIVYSWGVLHHTGDMRQGFDVVSGYVKPGGQLAIAVYNRHFTSPFWKAVKKHYVSSPVIAKKALIAFFYPMILAGKFVVTLENPFKMRRGMDFYHNVVDWVGGYPYEYASIKEVTGFFESRGFITERVIKAKIFTGCNEFVFRKDIRRAPCAE